MLSVGTRIALVGGCGGIGRAVAAATSVAGARLVVPDLPQSLQMHSPAAELALALDATDEKQVEDAFVRVEAEFGARAACRT